MKISVGDALTSITMKARGPSSILCVPSYVSLSFFFFLIKKIGQASLTFLFTSTKINKQIMIIIIRRKKAVELCFVLMFSRCFVLFFAFLFYTCDSMSDL